MWNKVDTVFLYACMAIPVLICATWLSCTPAIKWYTSLAWHAFLKFIAIIALVAITFIAFVAIALVLCCALFVLLLVAWVALIISVSLLIAQ